MVLNKNYGADIGQKINRMKKISKHVVVEKIDHDQIQNDKKDMIKEKKIKKKKEKKEKKEKKDKRRKKKERKMKQRDEGLKEGANPFDEPSVPPEKRDAIDDIFGF